MKPNLRNSWQRNLWYKNILTCATCAVAGLLINVNPAIAATKKAPLEFEVQMEDAPTFKGGYSSDGYKEELASAKKYSERSIASTDRDPNTVLTENFRNIESSFIGGSVYKDGKKMADIPGAKSSEEIFNLLNDLEKEFKSGKFDATPDAKLLAVQLLMLKPFRGFIYRSRNIFEAGNKRTIAAHAWAVSILRFMAAGIEVYLPTPQWKAAFNFMVEPYYKNQDNGCELPSTSKKSDTKKWIKGRCDMVDGPTFQAWLRAEVLPQLIVFNDTVSSMNFSTKPVFMDNQILYGSANFTSSRDRLVRIGESERFMLLSSIQASMSGLYGMEAFSFRGLFDSIDKISSVYGFQAAFSTDYATSEQRYNAIKAHPDLFRLKTEIGKDKLNSYLSNSYESLKTSVQNAYFSWVALRDHQNETDLQENLFDPRAVAPFARILNTGFGNAFGTVGISPPTIDKSNQAAKEIENGEIFSAVINSEKLVVHLKRLYTDPPANLQDFLPTYCNQESTHETKAVEGGIASYRNYRRGRPEHWQQAIYAKYFDGVSDDSKSIERISRILSQSWGGFMLGIPLSMMMM